MKSNQIKYLLFSLHNWIIRFEAGVTGLLRDAPEEKWVLGGGIEIPCTYKVYRGIDQKSYLLSMQRN